MAKIKDIDYLFLSTRIRALERKLVTGDRMERMLEASSVADAAKLLQECGYPEMEEVTGSSIDKMLAEVRQQTFADLYLFAPDPTMIDVFRVQYDYHNAKVLLKSEALGIDAQHLLMDNGRVPAEQLQESIRTSDLRGLPGSLREAILQARETLGSTRDPQLSDFVLDRACYKDRMELAKASGSAFLEGYVRIQMDATNLKSLVRTQRMGKDTDFLRGILFAGGNIDVSRIIHTVNAGTSVAELYQTTVFREAAEVGAAVRGGGQLTRFEKLCDDAVMTYIGDAKYVTFGEAPLIAYLAAKDSEMTTVRIILTGRLAGLPAETIRERLRKSYV